MKTDISAERDRLVQARDEAQKQYRDWPWSHSAEIAYLMAEERLRRFDAGKRDP